MKLDVLAVSDEVDQRIYSSSIRDRMGDVDMVFGCGDLPASYLEFLTDALHRPVFYVLGNHAEEITRVGERGEPRHPEGCEDLGFKVKRDPFTGLLMAGLPGSPRYSERDPVQYTEFEMGLRMLRMAPRLIWNRLRYGRALDVLVTHSPPRDVGDRDDPAHRGFQSMRTFLTWTRPAYLVHGHVHLYDRNTPWKHRFHETEVINVFPYRRLELDFPALPDPNGSVGPVEGSLRSELDAEEGTLS
ncbi:MAG TPA: metallophosphoesterase [Thermomicrobiales bacterium]|nr:metallophosphoesterase [Thermomicrobiales bacterium]